MRTARRGPGTAPPIQRAKPGRSLIALLLAVAPASGALGDQPLPACGDGVIFVAKFEQYGADPETASLVATSVAEGLRFGRASVTSPATAGAPTAVMSFVEVERLDDGIKRSMKALALSGTGVRDVTATFQRLTNRKLAMAGWVEGTLVRSGGSTTVELRLLCVPPRVAREPPPEVARDAAKPVRRMAARPRFAAAAKVPSAFDGDARSAAAEPAIASDGTATAPSRSVELGGGFSSRSATRDQATPVAKKVVRSSDAAGKDALLQAVFRAATKLISSERNEAPVVLVSGGASRRAPAGEEVVLDGSGTIDPDDDAIELVWRAIAAGDRLAPACVGWRQEGAQLRFRSSVPGKCTFELTARELLRPDVAPTQRVDVEVIVPPRVRVRESALAEMNGVASIELEGKCEHCSEWRWVQVSGPVTKADSWDPRPKKTFPVECTGDGREKPVCTVLAHVAGEYTFALTGWNDIGEDRKEYAVAVAPPPVALAYLPGKAIIDHGYVFDGSASHDMLGGELRYHWELSEQPFSGCDSRMIDANPAPDLDAETAGERGRTADDRLATPTSARTGFTSTRTVSRLYVRLTVLSERKFGGRSSTGVGCDQHVLPVKDPKWLLAIAGGSEWAATDRGYRGTRFSFVGSVRPGWLGPLAVRVEQTLARNDGTDTDYGSLGGTLVGVAWHGWPRGWTRFFQPYVSAYARTWGTTRDMFGVQAGVDVRIERLVFLSGGYRHEHANAKPWTGVVTGLLGVGYDL